MAARRFHLSKSLDTVITIFVCLFLIDLDECKILPDFCKNGKCVNTKGGAKCECPEGYYFNELKECQGKKLKHLTSVNYFELVSSTINLVYFWKC